VQVISLFALLKERGNKGPHLIVVPYVHNLPTMISLPYPMLVRPPWKIGAESSENSRLRYPFRRIMPAKKNGLCSGKPSLRPHGPGLGMGGRS
jgi:hypothetical protein